MDAFAGTWVCDKSKSDALSPFLEALGVSWLSRKAMDAGGVTWEIAPTAGGYNHTVTNVGGTKMTAYALGGVTNVDGADGNAYAVTPALQADGSLLVAAVGAKKKFDAVWRLDAGMLVVVTTILDAKGATVTVTRRYNKK